ncbi:AAA domain-containing protein [Mycoplasmopsis hyopharyngis]|uniref:AAA domain-containing protein n=1 Tax=Mycoplasmopsis hyopharyngis TaxID=29558 RepID=UPI003873C57B
MEKTKYTKNDIDFACSILDSWIKYNQYNPVPVVKTSNKKELSNEFSNFNFENFKEKVTIAKENLYIEFVLGNVPINGYVKNKNENEYLGEMEKTFVLSFILEIDKNKKVCIKNQVYSPIIFSPISTDTFDNRHKENNNEKINQSIIDILNNVQDFELENIDSLLTSIEKEFEKINDEIFKIKKDDSENNNRHWYIRIVYPEKDQEKIFHPCFFMDTDFYSNDILKIKNRLNSNKNIEDDKILDLILGKKDREGIDITKFKNILKLSNCIERPFVKWPSKYNLSLMQDVAVNAFLKETNEKIFSVNGPPGTGKTTLLKEIAAGVIFEKAWLIHTKNEWRNKLKTIQIGKNEYEILPDELKSLGILVASNNNKAVENISKEWPKPFDLKEQEWPNLFSNNENDVYFSRLIKEIYEILESNNQEKNNFWGSISLPWGNKQNREPINAFFANEKNKKLFDPELKVDPELKDDNNEIFWKFWETYSSINAEKEKQKWVFEAIKSPTSSLEKNRREEKKIPKFIKLNEKWIKLSNDLRIANQMKDVDSYFFKYFIEQFKNKNDKKIENIKYFGEKITFLLEKIKKQYSKKTLKLEKKLKKIIDKIEISSSSKFSNLWNIKEEDINKKEVQEKEFLPYTKNTEKERISLFYLSLQIIKQFILQHNLYQILFISHEETKTLEPSKQITLKKEQFYILNFIFPVISTTFASFGNNFKEFDNDSLGIGIIDEAGQASPFAALGFIERNKRNLIVGDPFQVKPVVSLPKSIINLVKEVQGEKVANKKADELLRIDLSIQELADSITKYYAKINKKRVGCPLKIHRRCQSPMFEISNKISYDETMINANSSTIKNANTRFIDVKNSSNNGNSNDEENRQAIMLIEKIIAETNEEDLPFIISPFKQVIENIKSIIRKQQEKAEKDAIIKNKWEILKTKNVGTVHTFQGREANTVFFVLGGNSNNKAAIRWALSEPNIINVAVTRAKKELIVIGNKELWQEVSDKNNGCFNVLVEEIEKIKKEESCENSSNQVAQ